SPLSTFREPSLGKVPIRILGPGRSWRVVMGVLWTISSSRIILMRSTKEELSPWEKLRRKIRTPAAISLERTSRLLDAGPMVARILVFIKESFCAGLSEQKGTGRPPSSGDDRNGAAFRGTERRLMCFSCCFRPLSSLLGAPA